MANLRSKEWAKGLHSNRKLLQRMWSLFAKCFSKVGYVIKKKEQENLDKAATDCDGQDIKERQGIWNNVMEVLSERALDPVSNAAFPSLQTATSLRYVTPFDDIPVRDEKLQSPSHKHGSQARRNMANIVPYTPAKYWQGLWSIAFLRRRTKQLMCLFNRFHNRETYSFIDRL